MPFEVVKFLVVVWEFGEGVLETAVTMVILAIVIPVVGLIFLAYGEFILE